MIDTNIINTKIVFLEKIFGKKNVRISKDNKNFSVPCPFCNKQNGKLKLAIRTKDDVTHCWVCGWSSRSLLPITVKFFKNYVDEYKKIFNQFSSSLIDDIEEKGDLKLPFQFTLLNLVKTEESKKFISYLNKRKITHEDIWQYKLGISLEEGYEDRIIFPSFSKDGALNFFTARSIRTNTRLKYLSCDAPKSEIIFNDLYLDFNIPIKICEGPFDMIQLGRNTTCLLGSELNENSKLFEELLMNKTDVILCLDSDMKFKTQQIARKLFEYDLNVKILNIGNKHDPGEMTKDELNQVLQNNSHEYNWGSFMKSKLENIKFGNIL